LYDGYRRGYKWLFIPEEVTYAVLEFVR